jgi:hypothetical protein
MEGQPQLIKKEELFLAVTPARDRTFGPHTGIPIGQGRATLCFR